MSILDKIVALKKEELLIRKIMVPVDQVVNSRYFHQPCISLAKRLASETTSGIIAEFKRKSPSKGFINQHADLKQVTADYTNSGAAGLSILTDHLFFGGSIKNIVITYFVIILYHIIN